MMSESNIECRNEIAMSMADIGDEVEKDQSSTLSQLDNTEDQNHASQETSMVGGILEQATKDTPKPSAPAREENKGNDSPASGPSVSMTNGKYENSLSCKHQIDRGGILTVCVQRFPKTLLSTHLQIPEA